MEQNYVNYGYTPVYHQLQGQPEPLPHFHHLTARTAASSTEMQHQPLPSIANFNGAIAKFESDDQGYQRTPPPPPYQFHPYQFQPMAPMWSDNNFTAYYHHHPAQPFMHRPPAPQPQLPPPPPTTINYPNIVQTQQNVQVQVIGGPPATIEETHRCDVCRRDFTSAAHLKRHVLTKAHVKAAVKSVGCIDLSELQERASAADPLIVRSRDKQFQVTITECDNGGSSITDLSEAEVVLIDSIDKELNAIEPSTLASFENVLVPEVTSSSSSSENGEFHCGVCNKTFAKRCYFTQHNKTAHAGVKPFKCTKCGKKFQAQVALDEHVAKHNGVKPFKCQQCPKSFNFKTDLKRHVILHTTEKPHVCAQCGKGFIRNDHLLKHLTSHRKKMEKLKRICSVNGVNF